MVVGCLGDMVFQVSEETIETIDNVTWSGSARYSTHQRHNMNALTEFTGVDPDKMSFTMILSAELGVEIIPEIVKLWDMERSGRAVPLVIGERPYGKYRWNLLRHSAKYTRHDRRGNPTEAEVSVELQEYITR
ncbi:phage tail protein [Acutalibacter muris]|uniref:phage tail protein n=1 Tax=Acutalibacter muris TaxID=1796620 RepID=UPI00272EE169|nr:phage tail protein [Acutalibacter muris]